MIPSPLLSITRNLSPLSRALAIAGFASILLGSGGVASAATVEVQVDPSGSFHRFVPEVVNINPGDTVRWVWGGGSNQLHTVTSGNYTGVVSGKDENSGVALVEVFHVQ